MIPDLVLGAGPSGLMVANRLQELKIPYLVLERGEAPMARTGDGFFYLHEPITGSESKFKITVTSCAWTDPKHYALKVYGDARVSPVSLKSQQGEHVGYQLDPDALLEPVQKSVLLKVEIAWIDTAHRMVFSRTGGSWPYARLHSTIPLPVLAKMMPRGPRAPFHSAPIWIESMPAARAPADLQPDRSEMRCHYCPGECHDWYRGTVRGQKAQFERMHQSAYGSAPVFPGKIWLDPANRDEEDEQLNQYRTYLESKDTYLWGRYAEWKPKKLLHQVWQDLKAWLK